MCQRENIPEQSKASADEPVKTITFLSKRKWKK
jgi:hypothetical protein